MYMEVILSSGQTFRSTDVTVDELLAEPEMAGDVEKVLVALRGLAHIAENPNKITNLALECDDGLERNFSGNHVVSVEFPGAKEGIKELRSRLDY